MAGSLAVQIEGLGTALGAVGGLIGEAPAGGGAGTGYAGASGIASVALDTRFGSVGSSVRQLAGLFDFDAVSSTTSVTDAFAGLGGLVDQAPTDALGVFGQMIADAERSLSGDLGGQLQSALDAVRGISNGVPQDRTAVVSELLDQLLGILNGLKGPEAEQITAWLASVDEMRIVLTPLIEQAQGMQDPSALALEVMQRALSSTADVLGFGQIDSFLRFLDGFPGRIVPTDLLTSVAAQLDATAAAYAAIEGAIGQPFPGLRGTVEAAGDTIQALKLELRPAIRRLNTVAEAPILQPHALERFLKDRIDVALGVEVRQVQKIDDPFKALFDRIDAQIDLIDLSFVREEVLAFFEQVRQTIETVDIPSIGGLVQDQVASLEQGVRTVEGGVTELVSAIRSFFDELGDQLQSAAGSIGTFQPDGTFRYHVADQLHETFSRARVAVAGDPASPDASSLAATIDDFKTTISELLAELRAVLQPIQDAIGGARDQAVEGIGEFVAFLEGLDIQALMDELKAQVQGIVDVLPDDFDALVDPIVAEIDDNETKLAGIDASSLNTLLREALKVALDVIISVDFSAEISKPLNDKFAEVNKVPADALAQLQQGYAQALGQLDALDPQQLLEALFDAFDVIDGAVGSVDLDALLEPLDALHEQFLTEPLASLRPSVILAPATEGFHAFRDLFDGLDGSQVIRPVEQQLSAFKELIAGFDVTSWIDDLVASVDKVKADLHELRPSGLLDPLVADFATLETELDRFKPSIVFAPVAALATPFRQLLETVQQEAVDALFEAFRAPLAALDRLRPTELTTEIQAALDQLLVALTALNVPGRFNQLKGRYHDLVREVGAGGDQRQVHVVELIDPEAQMGEFVTAWTTVVSAIEALRTNAEVPALEPLYDQVRERILGMLPAYAQTLLDVDAFKRLMRLADPSRFLEDLDTRFEAIKAKLIPIRPQDLTAELDASYESLLGLVEGLEIRGALESVKAALESVKGVAAGIRVDFVAADLDAAVARLKVLVEGLDPAQLVTELDVVHDEIATVVAGTRPSQLLSELGGTLTDVQLTISSVNPRVAFGEPLTAAWAAVEGKLAEVDLAAVLSPVEERLKELETAFKASLARVEAAFDQLLSAARAAIGGGGAAAGAGIVP